MNTVIVAQKMSKQIVIIEIRGGVAEYTLGNTKNGVDVIVIDHDVKSVDHLRPNEIASDNQCDAYVIGFENNFSIEKAPI